MSHHLEGQGDLIQADKLNKRFNFRESDANVLRLEHLARKRRNIDARVAFRVGLAVLETLESEGVL